MAASVLSNPRATGSPGMLRVGRTMRLRWVAFLVTIVLAMVTTATAQAATAEAATSTARLTVTQLSVHSGGTWGYDWVTIKGTGFSAGDGRAVAAVLFGAYPADSFSVVNATTIQAHTPEMPNVRTVTDVRVMLRDRTLSPRAPAGVFTFVVPTLDTRINGGWTANQSRAIGDSMIGKAGILDAQPVAASPGYWTPAMGRSALQRAAGWLGMPYSWAGGTYSGPSPGSCYGDGPNHVDCTYKGFDCSGLTLYAWAKYQHLAHFAATQFSQAGAFHPTLAELQPGDLLFFSGGGPVISHVVIYAGKGTVLQASGSGWPVRYSSLSEVMGSHPRYFGATRPMSLGAQGPPPIVSSVSITRSATTGGATMIIRGANLDTASQVDFGAIGTYSFTVNSPSAITVKIPAHAAGTANVQVTNAWGKSTVNKRAAVTYFGKPALTALSFSSSAAAGGSTVILTGSSFSPDARVYFGATPATSVHVLSSNHISVVAPSHEAGIVGVEVRTAYGSSSDRSFTYLAPPSTPAPADPAPSTTSPAG